LWGGLCGVVVFYLCFFFYKVGTLHRMGGWISNKSKKEKRAILRRGLRRKVIH